MYFGVISKPKFPANWHVSPSMKALFEYGVIVSEEANRNNSNLLESDIDSWKTILNYDFLEPGKAIVKIPESIKDNEVEKEKFLLAKGIKY